MPDPKGVVDSPFEDYISRPTPDKGDESNVSLQGGDPGYRKQDTPSVDIPMATSRHTNMDGGAAINNVATQSPDALTKRATGEESTPAVQKSGN